ncbi:LysM peptidoglycan-binding domain-containing protein [Pelagimonas varians]|uniref:LysM domain/BON superfamily protein n=1 Tax=Pelagimonas varians TaxID=696760 RepID=A0A238KKD3_9RHOB|nr:LysM domain-containing protein [Pelagimonas varians]PYG29228.1 LysM domain-containing protein [Pelagimonas varians]SMX43233.1 LysM domain/BON superfamily protein [Pelagimonas varians]
MIRLIALSFGTITMIGAVLWGLGDRPDKDRVYNEVSRSEPAPLSLSPAMAPSGIVLSQPAPTPEPAPLQQVIKQEVAAIPTIRPTARPAGLVQKTVSLTPPTVAAPAPQSLTPSTSGNDAVTALSYGIIGAFQRPVEPKSETPAPNARIPALGSEIATALAAEPKAQVRTYTVKDGDSLPGIAFRFYGTTVAYLQILSANPEQLANPADLRAGMILRVPETQ